MVMKRRKVLPSTDQEGVPVAPSSSSKATGGSRFKKRDTPNNGLLQREGTELAALVAQIMSSDAYGEVFHMANSQRFRAPKLRTGILALDLPFGGGVARGRASMFYGERSAGKSTLSLLTMAALHRQRPDAVGAWVDPEGTFDPIWAEKLGVDTSRLVITEPNSGEDGVDLADALIRTKEIEYVVTDSIATLIPMKEVEATTAQEFMGLQARLIGKYVRKTTQAMVSERKRDHLVMLTHINQFRMKLGLVFGDPRTLPGGKALEYSTSQQMEIKNKETMGKTEGESEELVMFNEHSLKVSKNKTGGPLRESSFKLIRTAHKGMPEGWVDQSGAIYHHGSKIGLVTGAKNSFSLEGSGVKSFRGAEDFSKWAVENQDVYYRIIDRIIDGYLKKWDLV